MQFNDNALRGTIAKHSVSPRREDARPGILVPVNPSASAFNALAYALNLARAMHSAIHLVHITDARELPDSGNPLVISRMLDRMETKASNCVVSLKEMIEESGVQVGCAESVIGSMERLVVNKVEELMPEFLVLGKDSLPDAVIRSIIRHSGIPVIIVPNAVSNQLPDSMMLSALGSPFSRSGMSVVNKLLVGVAPSVTTVSYQGNKKSKEAYASIGRYLQRGIRGQIEEIQIEGNRTPGEVADFIGVHEFDLVCIARQKGSLWKRFFRPDSLQELPFRLDVTTMVV